jgi:hypothetical protein
VANPGLSQKQMQEALDAYNRHGSMSLAAKSLGLTNGAYHNRLWRAQGMQLRPSEAAIEARVTQEAQCANDNLQRINDALRSEIDVLRQSLAEASRPRFTIRADNVKRSEKIKGIVIGDAHDSPHIEDKERFAWIGAHVNAIKPDFVEQIGDFFTLDSLNSHVGNETFSGKSKPTFKEDMVSGNTALEAYASRLNWKCEHHTDEGNHERRIYIYEEAKPETSGSMVFQYHKMLESHGWTHSPYGHINYRGGVGFVHAAINRLGKTIGGKNAETTIANESVHDLVIGHSHTHRLHKAAKIGGNGYVQILNTGCALPDQMIEEYAKHSLTGWSYGITEVIIQHGHIQDHTWVSMERLKEMYGG